MMWQHSQGCDIHGSIPAGSISSHLLSGLSLPLCGRGAPAAARLAAPLPLGRTRTRLGDTARTGGYRPLRRYVPATARVFHRSIGGTRLRMKTRMGRRRRWMRLRCQWTASGGTLIGARCSVFDARSGMAGPTYVYICIDPVCVLHTYTYAYTSRVSATRSTPGGLDIHGARWS